MRRRRLLATAVAGVLAAFAGCSTDGADGDSGDDATPTGTGTAALSVTSAAFADGESLPTRHSCDGEGGSPPLAIGDVPAAAETLALVVDDPDAPRAEPFVHWLVWNVPADLPDWPAGVSAGERAPELDDAPQGTNSAGRLGWVAACPPRGDGPHRYRFTAHAADRRLDLAPGAERGALESALSGAVVARGRLVGTYERE